MYVRKIFFFCVLFAGFFGRTFGALGLPLVPGSDVLYEPGVDYIGCSQQNIFVSVNSKNTTPCNSLSFVYQNSFLFDHENTLIRAYSRTLQATLAKPELGIHGQYQRLQPIQEYFSYDSSLANIDFQATNLQYLTAPNSLRLQFDGYTYASFALEGMFTDELSGYVDHLITIRPHNAIDLAWHRIHPRHHYLLQLNTVSNTVSSYFSGDALFDVIETNIRWREIAQVFFASNVGQHRYLKLRSKISFPRDLTLLTSVARRKSTRSTEFLNLGVSQGGLSAAFDEISAQAELSWSYRPHLQLIYESRWSRWTSDAEGELNDSLLQSIFDPFELTRREYQLRASLSTLQLGLTIRYHGKVNVDAGAGWLSITPSGEIESWLPGFFLLPNTDYSEQHLGVEGVDLGVFEVKASVKWFQTMFFVGYKQLVPLRLRFDTGETQTLFDEISRRSGKVTWGSLFPVEGSVFEIGASYRF